MDLHSETSTNPLAIRNALQGEQTPKSPLNFSPETPRLGQKAVYKTREVQKCHVIGSALKSPEEAPPGTTEAALFPRVLGSGTRERLYGSEQQETVTRSLGRAMQTFRKGGT